MRVLIACEYSGRVRHEFEVLGHDAMSCDLLPSELPGHHHIGDVLDILNDGWDLMIAHPPCTYLTYAAIRHWNNTGRDDKRFAAVGFVSALYNSNIPQICIENPVGYLNTIWRKPDQIINPYQFGDRERKRTCLWLKNLPPLMHTAICDAPEPKKVLKTGKKIYFTDSMSGSDSSRAVNRSRTFRGIARAMAMQWGG